VVSSAAARTSAKARYATLRRAGGSPSTPTWPPSAPRSKRRAYAAVHQVYDSQLELFIAIINPGVGRAAIHQLGLEQPALADNLLLFVSEGDPDATEAPTGFVKAHVVSLEAIEKAPKAAASPAHPSP